MAICEGRWDCPSCGSTAIYGRHVECAGCARFYLHRFVIDGEYIVGLPADDPHVSVIIYEVVAGRIRNAWFTD